MNSFLNSASSISCWEYSRVLEDLEDLEDLKDLEEEEDLEVLEDLES